MAATSDHTIVTSMNWRIVAACLVLWTASMPAQTPADPAADPAAAAQWEELAKRQKLAGDYAAALMSYKRFKEEHDRILVQNAAAGRWRLGRNLIGGAAVLLALIGLGVAPLLRRGGADDGACERHRSADRPQEPPLHGADNRRRHRRGAALATCPMACARPTPISCVCWSTSTASSR